MWQRIKAFFLKLFGRKNPLARPDVIVIPPRSAHSTPARGEPAPQAELSYNYSDFIGLTPFEIQTRVFHQGLPEGWDWQKWALAAGRPNPVSHDNRDAPIVPMPAFQDPDALVDSGEMDLMPGEVKLVTTTTNAQLSWAAHAPQYIGTMELFVGSSMFTGAYMVASLTPGTYPITYNVGPSQGVRVALRKR